jgi:hypothetical protein
MALARSKACIFQKSLIEMRSCSKTSIIFWYHYARTRCAEGN